MARRGENIYKRQDGRYEGRYIKYYDISGKAVYGYIYSRNYSDIKEMLAKCKTDKKISTTTSNIRLADWIDTWLKSQSTLKSTTKRVYQGHINNHIAPALGSVPLKKLNADILQDFVNGLECSPTTVKTIFSTLKAALITAEEKGLIFNCWNKVKLPKKQKSFVRVLTKNEQQRLEGVLTDNKSIGIWISLYTGLRIGELCALRWSEIDFTTSKLTVTGTQARTEKGVEIISPKSKSSKREIPIPPLLIDKLKAVPHDTEFVLSKSGKPIEVRSYRRYFKSVLKAADLPDIKFHATRHTFATRALEVGMDYKTLSEILGHSTVSITLDLYAHSLDEHKHKEMSKLCEIYSA